MVRRKDLNYLENECSLYFNFLIYFFIIIFPKRNAPQTVHFLSLPLCNLFHYIFGGYGVKTKGELKVLHFSPEHKNHILTFT